MTENRIKENLAAAIENETPDMLEQLMQELELKDEPRELLGDLVSGESKAEKTWSNASPKRNSGMRKAVLGFAAALVMVFAGLSVLNKAGDAFAIVSLDVNPGIEISIDDKEKVISATPVNEEAKEVIADMDLNGSDINVACNAIVGSMLTHGYLSDISNSILVSVSAENKEAGSAIEKRLSGQLNTFLENSNIAAAILGQAVQNDEEIRGFADANGISIGKAWLIKNLLKTGSTKMTEENLLKLTSQELILLGQKRGAAGTVSYGDAESGKYIGGDKAISIALSKAGIDKSAARNLKYEFDCEDGVLIYEVSFYAGDYEYDYDINAINGSVVSYEKEYEGPRRSTNSSGSGNASGSDSGGSKSKSNNSSGGSGTVRSGDDTYKVEGGVVYEYDDDYDDDDDDDDDD